MKETQKKPFQKTRNMFAKLRILYNFEALENCFPWLNKSFTSHLGASQRNAILKPQVDTVDGRNHGSLVTTAKGFTAMVQLFPV